jgi:hypothetical protein
MKKITLLTFFCLILASCFNQPARDCTEFKTGKFKAEFEVKGQRHSTLLERNDSIQIETYQGKTDTASVRWVSDCEYIVQNMNPQTMAQKKAYAIRILNTSKNSYTFEFGEVDSDVKQTGTVTKLN